MLHRDTGSDGVAAACFRRRRVGGMRHRFLLGIAVGVAALVAGAQAQAQNGPGSFYIGGEGGWTSLENQKATAVGLSGTVHADDGFNVGGRAGYMWGPWRFEEEVNYRRNGLKIGRASCRERV